MSCVFFIILGGRGSVRYDDILYLTLQFRFKVATGSSVAISSTASTPNSQVRIISDFSFIMFGAVCGITFFSGCLVFFFHILGGRVSVR